MKTTKQVSALLIAALVAGGVSTAASAQSNTVREDRRAELFAEMDTNGDGSVSAEEFANAPGRFARADANGDGLLTAGEIATEGQGRAEARAERMIARFDSNKDGMLSQDEIGNRRDGTRFFERLDANDDGVVSAEEFADARMGERHGKRGWFHDGKRHNNR